MNIAQKLSYGVYVVTTECGGKPYGCVANCAVQITSQPATFAVSINRNNYTNARIKESGRFAISVLAVDSDPAIIGTFGFKSGATVDKFAGVAHVAAAGLPVISDSCGYLVCKVIDTMETPTHTVFLGELEDSGSFGDREQMTYDYYHKVIKGSAPKNAPTYVPPSEKAAAPEKPAAAAAAAKKYVCSICGYEHEGELPDGFECPICGAGKEAFEEVR